MVEVTWFLPNGALQSMSFDATPRELHDSTATPTEHGVTAGANISDHIQPGLDRLSLNVVVSNQPIFVPDNFADNVTGRFRSIDLQSENPEGREKATVLVFDTQFDRPRNVHEELLRRKALGTLLEIFTRRRTYSSMVVTRVSPIEEAATGDALVATVDFREMRIVDSEVVEDPLSDLDRARANSQRGQQNTEDADDETETRQRSMLASLVDSGVSLFR